LVFLRAASEYCAEELEGVVETVLAALAAVIIEVNTKKQG
jgi:hypothetical protein